MSPDTLSFMAFAIHDNKIWCSNLNFNGLFTINLNDGKVDYIGRFAGYDEKKVGLHRFVKKYDNKLIFFPNYSTSIDIYDFSGKFSKCNIDSWEIKKENRFTCASGAYYWNDLYYVFPRFSEMNLIKYNPEKNEICEEIELCISNQLCKKEESQMVYNSVHVNNEVYMPIFGTNYIVKYNLETEEEQTITLPSKDKIAGRMDYDGDTFWLNCDGYIIRYDKDFNDKISLYAYDQEKGGIVTRFAFHNEFVLVIPAYLGALKVVNTKKNTVEEIMIDSSKFKLQIGPISRWRHTDNVIFLNEGILINPIGLRCGLQIDFCSKEIKKIEYKVPLESIPIDDLNVDYLLEQKKTDLEEFLFYINYFSGKIK